MRVIDYKHRRAPKPRRRVRAWLSDRMYHRTIILLVVAFAGAFLLVKYVQPKVPGLQQQKAPSELVTEGNQPYGEDPNKKQAREFTGEAFRQLYDSLALPNTKPIDESLPIFGNVAADQVIRQAAELRGYRLQSVPERPLVEIEKQQLQEPAAKAWEELKIDAASAGIDLELVAAFRSPYDQRKMFTEYFTSAGVAASSIGAGRATKTVDTALQRVSVPGYSRHHNGYTVDIGCGSDPVAFGKSHCFAWLSDNNYENAKKHGWIPSYPPGAGLQGPEPEPWEYVWVGVDILHK